FGRPASLERCLDRRIYACHPSPPRPAARRAPTLLPLEDREAPQLFVPMAAAVGGAIVATQVLARPAHAFTAEYAPVSVASAPIHVSPPPSREATGASQAVTARREEVTPSQVTEEGGAFSLLTSLDVANDRANPASRGVSPSAVGDAMPTTSPGEPSVADGGP